MEQQMRLIPFEVKSIEPKASQIPYGVEQIQAPLVWEKGEKGQGCVVAILDTGIDVNHPDLKDRIIGGRNFTHEGSKDDFSDENGHGTHVAGTIAGNGNIFGVAPECQLLICKVLGRDGGGSYQGITDAIRWATNWRGENGERVRVMNLSLGGSYRDERQYEAIKYALSKGILIVVASGNEGDSDEETFEYGYPALFPECITVAASDKDQKLAYFSNNHRQVDVISSGVDVLSTYPKSTYAVLSGTSMATPHVSGALALIINRGEKHFGRTLTEAEVYALLVHCTCDLEYKASSQGHGLVNLENLNKKCRE